MGEELVSIIIPAFNAERYIAKALSSIRSQTYRNWEIVFVNDGGSDGTAAIVADFARTVSQPVWLFAHAQPQGPSAARNTAMKASHGGLIAFLDADDFWLPDHLEGLTSLLQSGRAHLAYSECFVFRETPSGEIELLPIETIEVTNPGVDLFRRNFINPSSAAITRTLMRTVGEFDISMRGWEDIDYWIRAAIARFPIVGIGRQTCYYRKSEGALSSSHARMAEGMATVYEKHRNCGLLPEAEIVKKASDCYFSAGRMSWRSNAASASRNFHKAWTLDKHRIKPIVWYFLSAGLSLAQRA